MNLGMTESCLLIPSAQFYELGISCGAITKAYS